MLKDQRGQVLVEFGLIAPIFLFLIIFLVILGLWIYNSNTTNQAARMAAHYLAVTGNASEAKINTERFLSDRNIAAKTKQITIGWNGSMARAVVETEMETFFPGLPKLLNNSSSNWKGKVLIRKEAITTGEYRFRPEAHGKFN